MRPMSPTIASQPKKEPNTNPNLGVFQDWLGYLWSGIAFIGDGTLPDGCHSCSNTNNLADSE